MRVSYKPVKMEEYNPKGTILRVACFKNGKQVSKVYNRTFIVLDEKDRHYNGLDVICLVTEKDNLFAKDSGIYASGGLMRLNKPNANFYQRGRAWEKPANITLIEQDGNIAFSHSIGIRLHGGKTRKNAQKSFRLYTRSKYGAPVINYDFFKAGNTTQHKKLILRAANSSWGVRYMADDVIAEVCKPLAVDVLDSHPVLLYLNGEFWGIYSIREYFDDEFLKTHHKVSRKELSIAYHGVGYRPNVHKGWGIIKGETKDLTNLYHFLAFKDSLFDSDYGYVKTVLNMQSIIDYYCVEIYFNNRDWPTNNNKLWKVKEGKWNQVLYDMDACFSRLSENTFRRILKPDGKRQNAPYATLLFRKLVTSPQFLKEFTGRMEDLMNNELASYKIIACIDKYAKLYRNVIHQHCNRYSEPKNRFAWESQMQLMRQFAEQRKGAIRKFMREEFPQAY